MRYLYTVNLIFHVNNSLTKSTIKKWAHICFIQSFLSKIKLIYKNKSIFFSVIVLRFVIKCFVKILITTSLDIRFKYTIDENVEMFIKKRYLLKILK